MVHPGSSAKRKSRPASPSYATDQKDYELNLDDSVYSSTIVPDFKVNESSAEIVYGTRAKSLRYLSNFCKHTTSSMVLVGGSQWTDGLLPTVNPDRKYHMTSPSRHSSDSSGSALAAGKAALGLTGTSILGANGQGYINDAFAKLKPDLTSVSIPNFLLELDDIPRMWQLWKRDLALAKNLANARLNWSYGWKPFLGDLQAMKSTILSVYQQCVEWNKKAGSIEHRTMTFDSIQGSASGNITYPSGSNKTYWSITQTGTVTAHLTFRTLAIPELRTMQGVLRVYLDALGFELNPRILWDAIPFSFVLDWFFDVGGWCNRFKRDTLELPIVLIDSCLQYKEELRCESYWQRVNDGVYVPAPRGNPVVRVETLFQRLPIFPDLSAATAAGWKIPGVNQLINAISLGTALRRT